MMRKLLFLLLAGSLVLLMSPDNSFAFAKGTQECRDCHTLDAANAKNVLGVIIPDVKVLSVEDGPVSGLWEVGFEARGKKGIAYIDYSLKYLFAGNVVSILTKTNLTQESFAKINKVDVSQIPLENALVMGDQKAPKKVIVFDDPD